MVATPANYETVTSFLRNCWYDGIVVQQSKTGCRQTEDPQDVQGMVQPGMAMRMQYWALATVAAENLDQKLTDE